jgi:hypothetical protein
MAAAEKCAGTIRASVSAAWMTQIDLAHRIVAPSHR